MPGEPFFEFEWVVAADYQWVEWLDAQGNPVRPSGLAEHPNTGAALTQTSGQETGPVLTPQPGPTRTIHPMDRQHAALFQQFAELDPTDANAIAAFAGQYGCLGIMRIHQRGVLSDGSLHYAEGEPQQIWMNEIAKMREAIRLYRDRDYAKLNAEKLTWLFNQHLQHVQGRVSFGVAGPDLRLAPTNLLAAMWLQLALAVTGNKDFVKCKFCGRQLEISTAQSGYRTNRLFCTSPCKTNDYRKRRRKALDLARRGESVKAIAQLADTDEDTVRGWVKSLRKQARERSKTMSLRRTRINKRKRQKGQE